jgi:hypothetical protein
MSRGDTWRYEFSAVTRPNRWKHGIATSKTEAGTRKHRTVQRTRTFRRVCARATTLLLPRSGCRTCYRSEPAFRIDGSAPLLAVQWDFSPRSVPRQARHVRPSRCISSRSNAFGLILLTVRHTARTLVAWGSREETPPSGRPESEPSGRPEFFCVGLPAWFLLPCLPPW